MFSARDCETGTLRKCLRNSNRLVLNLRPSLRALAVLGVRMFSGPGCVERRRLSGGWKGLFTCVFISSLRTKSKS